MESWIISDQWYNDKRSSPDDEAKRVTEIAAKFIESDIRDNLKGSTDTFPSRVIQKVYSLKIPEFDPPPPPPHPLVIVRPCSFSSIPPSPLLQVRSIWLELTLSPSISVLVKFREKKLIMSTGIFG